MGSKLRGDRRPGPDTDRARVATAATGVLILLVLLGSTLGAPVATTPDRDFDRPEQTLRSSSSTLGPSMPRPTIPNDPRTQTPTWLFVLIGMLLLTGVAVVGWLVLRRLALILRERRRDATPPPRPIPPEAAGAALLEDRRLHWEALDEGPAEEAVVAMWVALEHSVARAGVEREAAETSAELTLRVLDHLAVDGVAVETLAELYREARFSQHRLTDAQRDRARDALRRIHDSLSRRHRPLNEPEATP